MAFDNPITTLPGSAITGPIDGGQLIDGSVVGTKLSADAIDGKVITGAVIRTTAGTPRIQLQSSDNTLTAEDGTTSFAQLTPGKLLFGGYNPNTGNKWTGGAAYITADLNTMTLVGAGDTTSGSADYAPRLIFDAGIFGLPKSELRLDSLQAGTPANFKLTGAVTKTGATWQTPSYGTNWAAGTSFNGNVGYHSLQYRLDAEDNVHMVGVFVAGATAPTNPVFTLPAGYRPAGSQPVWCQRNNGGVLTFGHLYVGTGGNVNVPTGSGLGIAAGNEYIVSGHFPLNTIP
ncbi:hypothetical protein AB0K51_12355 [Kitasatospora sp. NPDC049285]|uniref:hypothetical protein n=1 Tax=Kitasatospora sp. NPDC049285 TaxID=3157096 RepID=UPI00344102E5